MKEVLVGDLIDSKLIKKKDKVDDFQTYLNEIIKVPLLSEQEEMELMLKVKAGNKEAYNQMVEANLRLVVYVVKNQVHNGNNKRLIFSDLVAEGNLGLMKALDKFDISRGVRFSTYATWWIRQAVYSAIYNKYNASNFTIGKKQLVSKFNKKVAELTIQNGFKPDIYEVYEALEFSKKEIKSINDHLIVSEQMNDGVGALESKALETYQDETHELFDMSNEQLWHYMDEVLDDREKDIIYHRFFLNETLDEIGKNEKFNITKERIRQIEEKALLKLRKAMTLKRCEIEEEVID